MSDDFGPKLALVLKALTISNGRLAADLAVDKSLVGRWAAGTVRPSAHNLSRLTAHLAKRLPGLTLLDWDRPLADLRRIVDARGPAEPPAASAQVPLSQAPALAMLPFGLVKAAAEETARRGGTYTGRWRTTRLCTSRPGLIVEYALIRPEGTGLWLDFFIGHHTNSGWLLILNNKLYSLVADDGHDSFGFFLLNGVIGTKAERLHGICTSVNPAAAPEPVAMAMVFERVGDLQGREADAEWAERAAALAGGAPDVAVPDDIRALLTRNLDAAATANGDAAILCVTNERSLSRGRLPSKPVAEPGLRVVKA